jgi:predicted helicase
MAGQFSDFYNSLDTDALKRGRQFERFLKWFLQTDPEWATQVDQVWMWEEYIRGGTRGCCVGDT